MGSLILIGIICSFGNLQWTPQDWQSSWSCLHCYLLSKCFKFATYIIPCLSPPLSSSIFQHKANFFIPPFLLISPIHFNCLLPMVLVSNLACSCQYFSVCNCFLQYSQHSSHEGQTHCFGSPWIHFILVHHSFSNSCHLKDVAQRTECVVSWLQSSAVSAYPSTHLIQLQYVCTVKPLYCLG